MDRNTTIVTKSLSQYYDAQCPLYEVYLMLVYSMSPEFVYFPLQAIDYLYPDIFFIVILFQISAGSLNRTRVIMKNRLVLFEPKYRD